MTKFKVGDEYIVHVSCCTLDGKRVVVKGDDALETIDGSDHCGIHDPEQGYYEPVKKGDPMDNLKQGDVLVNDDSEMVVQGVLGEIVFYTFNDDFSDSSMTVTLLKRDGWHLKDSTDTVEKTVAELEKELNMPAGTLRVKAEEK